MYLLDRPAVGAGEHRSGWPCVVQELQKLCNGSGLMLDDFADKWFAAGSGSGPRTTPWIGIFHNPVRVNSKLVEDMQRQLKCMQTHPQWEASLPYLRGCVGLSHSVTSVLREWLNLPTLHVKFATAVDVPRWDAEQALRYKMLTQVGHYLRNTRLICQIDVPGWQRRRLLGACGWARERSHRLRELTLRPDVRVQEVTELEQVSSDEYDAILSSTVVVTEFYGAAASNLVVECIVRGTPLVVNRLPAIEEYLGTDYCLYYDSIRDIPSLLSESLLLRASAQLLERAALLPSFSRFATEVHEFVSGLERS